MTKLELFLFFLVEYIKEVLIPKTNKLVKHSIDIGQFMGGLIFGSTWVAGS